jgi:Ran GTPase-activating protein (RanGAP) involved in mRNA processing and transport
MRKNGFHTYVEDNNHEIIHQVPHQRHINMETRYNKKDNRYLDSFVEEVLSFSVGHNPTPVPHRVTEHFHSRRFVDKLDHPHLEDIPLTSQITRQKSIWPTHSSDKRRLIMDICKQLKVNDGGMVKLRLGSYDIDDNFLKMICDNLLNNTYLQFLILHNNSITDTGVEYIVKALRRHPAVHTLWLGDNKVSDDGIRCLCSLLQTNKHIRDIIVSNKWPHPRWTDVITAIHPHVTQIGADMIADTLRRGSSLTNLSLAHQRVRDVGAEALFRALPFSKIRSLNLEANELTDASCVSCKICLADNPCLEKLVLSKNEIGDVGACSLSQGLSHNKFLKVLDLSYNKIDAAGMNGLYFGVSMSKTMWSIIVVGNAVVDDRFEAIFEARQPKLDFSAGLPATAYYAESTEEMPWKQTLEPVKLPPVPNVGFHGHLPTIVDNKLTTENLDTHNKLNVKKSGRSRYIRCRFMLVILMNDHL